MKIPSTITRSDLEELTRQYEMAKRNTTGVMARAMLLEHAQALLNIANFVAELGRASCEAWCSEAARCSACRAKALVTP